MSQGLETDIKQIVLSSGTFGPAQIQEIVAAISEDSTNYSFLREATAELEASEQRSPASAVRLGVCNYLIGKYHIAVETLKNADGGALAHFYMGKAHFALRQYDEAIECYKSAAQAGYNTDEASLAQAEALRYAGDGQAAMETLDRLFGAVEQTAEYLYQRGATVASIGGNPQEVVALYERAVESNPKHPGALFGLALENDRRGNDETAIELYERATSRFPAYVGALLNLGVLYEDTGRYDAAGRCYRRVLDVAPDHPRARLYLKDVEACHDMFYDEDAQRRRERLSQVLSIPVTDFELSVRSRNCLSKMGINSLGDLTRISEAELLGSKNFGETSLTEISEMLTSRGLRLGQFATSERRAPEPVYEYESETLSPDEKALLDRSISDLNLSVRARKCMVRLGITTIGELIRHTGDDLLECKNFGVTSLNETREKLVAFGIKLRGD